MKLKYLLIWYSLQSKIITIRVGRALEPDTDLLDDTCTEESGNSDTDEEAEEDKRKRGCGSEANSQPRYAEEEDENNHENSYLYSLFNDDVEEDGDYESDNDYEYDSPNEHEEEYDNIEIKFHFKDNFYVHEDVLCSSSDFFNAALSKGWKERRSGRIDLPDNDPEAFTIYARWLYTGRIFLAKAGDNFTVKDAKGTEKHYDKADVR